MAGPQPERGSDRVREVIRDGFTIAVGAAAWAFDEGDRLVGRWLEMGQVSRQETRQRFEQFKSRTADGVRNATAGLPVATREQLNSLERRVEELTREVEALRRGPRDPLPPV